MTTPVSKWCDSALLRCFCPFCTVLVAGYHGDVAGAVLLGLVFGLLLVMAVWSYLRTSFTPPGFLPPVWHAFLEKAPDLPNPSVRREWTPMLFWAHIWLVTTNTTTLESSYDGRNPYRRGRRQNAEQIFGRLGWDWLLPIRPRRPVCDGLSYPSFNFSEHEDSDAGDSPQQNSRGGGTVVAPLPSSLHQGGAEKDRDRDQAGDDEERERLHKAGGDQQGSSGGGTTLEARGRKLLPMPNQPDSPGGAEQTTEEAGSSAPGAFPSPRRRPDSRGRGDSSGASPASQGDDEDALIRLRDLWSHYGSRSGRGAAFFEDPAVLGHATV
uniref:Palmitoyltransferase n=1 Tax=Chromera velia CCMP2878 TaxID=1169474 RepID=A0A0G4GH04_9ALVE|eukprot:Cvel_21858.t1-p1 / transcript=Cvel_21858.t1 / gene=Cvel_21858 / organism=Chromera_velia_CCMP2878 / gene_product=hypothetical protein / transcript_product=hypothetical protein / location=Cvel_scaffold2089:12804-18499(-) / protein_length=323 / sequence_SO=supercontig / SO=protein_coding / is_pseudo=false